MPDTVDPEGKKTIPSISIDTVTIEKRLDETEVGDIVTYAELNGLIGRDTQEGARGNLHTACKHLTARGKPIICVFGIGVKHATPEEAIDAGEYGAKRASKAVKKGSTYLATVDPTKLSPDDAIRLKLSSAVLGAIAACASRAAGNRIEQTIRSGGALPDKGAVVDMFS